MFCVTTAKIGMYVVLLNTIFCTEKVKKKHKKERKDGYGTGCYTIDHKPFLFHMFLFVNI